MTCRIPIKIPDEEHIARAIRVPEHYDKRKNKIKPAAFRPAPEKDDLSVMRIDHMGADSCKAKAKQIHNDSYIGFAAISAGEIRSAKGRIVDSRGFQFCGHAHIEQGMPAPKRGASTPPELQVKYKELADKARPYIDPDPTEKKWTGPRII
jgi:hypothetical protein